MQVSKRIRQIFGSELAKEFADWTEECDDCFGTGKRYDGPCLYCDGAGSYLTDVGELVRYIQEHCPPKL